MMKTRLHLYLMAVVAAVVWAIGAVWEVTNPVVGWFGVAAYVLAAAFWAYLVLGAAADIVLGLGPKESLWAYVIASIAVFALPAVAIWRLWGDAACYIWTVLIAVGLLGILYEWYKGRL